MAEIRFYHLQTQSQEQALPALLSKAVEMGKRIVLKLIDIKEVEVMDAHLWTYSVHSFLPHGCAKTGNAELQPIWITAQDENPNNADVLIVGHGAVTEMQADFDLCCEVFDGRDEKAVADARTRWKSYKDKDYNVTYWKQNEQGGWDKKS